MDSSTPGNPSTHSSITRSLTSPKDDHTVSGTMRQGPNAAMPSSNFPAYSPSQVLLQPIVQAHALQYRQIQGQRSGTLRTGSALMSLPEVDRALNFICGLQDGFNPGNCNTYAKLRMAQYWESVESKEGNIEIREARGIDVSAFVAGCPELSVWYAEMGQIRPITPTNFHTTIFRGNPLKSTILCDNDMVTRIQIVLSKALAEFQMQRRERTHLRRLTLLAPSHLYNSRIMSALIETKEAKYAVDVKEVEEPDQMDTSTGEETLGDLIGKYNQAWKGKTCSGAIMKTLLGTHFILGFQRDPVKGNVVGNQAMRNYWRQVFHDTGRFPERVAHMDLVKIMTICQNYQIVFWESVHKGNGQRNDQGSFVALEFRASTGGLEFNKKLRFHMKAALQYVRNETEYEIHLPRFTHVDNQSEQSLKNNGVPKPADCLSYSMQVQMQCLIGTVAWRSRRTLSPIQCRGLGILGFGGHQLVCGLSFDPGEADCALERHREGGHDTRRGKVNRFVMDRLRGFWRQRYPSLPDSATLIHLTDFISEQCRTQSQVHVWIVKPAQSLLKAAQITTRSFCETEFLGIQLKDIVLLETQVRRLFANSLLSVLTKTLTTCKAEMKTPHSNAPMPGMTGIRDFEGREEMLSRVWEVGQVSNNLILRQNIRSCSTISHFREVQLSSGFNECLMRLQEAQTCTTRLDRELWAENWAKALTHHQAWAEALNNDRKTVKCLIRAQCDFWKGRHGTNHPLAAEEIFELGTNGLSTKEMVKLCVIMDRARFLYHMIDFGPSSNVRGMHWYADSDKHRVFLREKGFLALEDVTGHTMNRRYLWFIDEEELNPVGLWNDEEYLEWTRPVASPLRAPTTH